MYQLILASASPRRKEILNQVGAKFITIVSHIEEHMTQENPQKIVQTLSYEKAAEVAKRVDVSNAVILGADTIVVLENKILGKPSSMSEAEQMLEMLSGKVHEVDTGVCILILEQGKIKEEISFVDQTKVEFYPLTKEEILSYIATGESMDKAGAYALQGRSAPYIARIEGDYYNVVGLPIAKIYQKLKRYGIDLITGEKCK